MDLLSSVMNEYVSSNPFLHKTNSLWQAGLLVRPLHRTWKPNGANRGHGGHASFLGSRDDRCPTVP